MDAYQKIMDLVEEHLGPYAAAHVEMWAKGNDFLQELYEHGLRGTKIYREVSEKRQEEN